MLIKIHRRGNLRFLLEEGNRLNRAGGYTDAATEAPVKIYGGYPVIFTELHGSYLAGLDAGFTTGADVRVNLGEVVAGPTFKWVRVKLLPDQLSATAAATRT